MKQCILTMLDLVGGTSLSLQHLHKLQVIRATPKSAPRHDIVVDRHLRITVIMLEVHSTSPTQYNDEFAAIVTIPFHNFDTHLFATSHLPYTTCISRIILLAVLYCSVDTLCFSHAFFSMFCVCVGITILSIYDGRTSQTNITYHAVQ